MTEQAPQEEPRGTAIFWAGVLAFVVGDFSSVLAPWLGSWLPAERVVPVLSYVLLAGFALTLAFVAGVVVTAIRSRRAPPVPDAFRAAIALALAVGHAVLIVVARVRKG
jgi:hypothetical protein